MVADNVLWVILVTGFLVAIAYVRSEFRSHRTSRALLVERSVQQRQLWAAGTLSIAAGSSKGSDAAVTH